MVIGGSVGSQAGKHLPTDLLEQGLGVVFAFVAVVVLVTTFP
ncbi:hypothetical protein [Haloparvum sp. AD34]